MQSHGEVNSNYKCIECDELFTHINHLKAHQQIHLPSAVSEFECYVYKKVYTIKGRLLHHFRLNHSEPYKFKCNESGCNKVFKTNLHYDNHQKMHTKDELYKYYVCGRSFSQGNHLNRHHNNDHIYEDVHVYCPHYEEPYRSDYQLTIHIMNKHTKDRKRPYRCEPCKLGYAHKQGLNAHIREKH